MANDAISILGCGWLGMALGRYLNEQGFFVRGSTTTSTKLPLLEEAGMKPFQLALEPDGLKGEDQDDFLASGILIVAIPPGRKNPQVARQYPEKFQQLVRLMNHGQKMIFTGSTSVYANLNREVKEEDAGEGELRESGKALLQTETLLQKQLDDRVTILRLGGLIGYDRHPGRFLRSGKVYAGGKRPVNLTHRDDCIRAIEAVFRQEAWGRVFNVVAEDHPTRQEFYEHAAHQLGLDPPVFQDDDHPSFKIVSNRKIKQQLSFQFKYGSPFDWLNDDEGKTAT